MGQGRGKKLRRRRRGAVTGKADARDRATLIPLIREHPAVLHVLDEHGVTFCAGCYLTLSSPLDRVAAYHAVPDVRRFLADLKKASSR